MSCRVFPMYINVLAYVCEYGLQEMLCHMYGK